MNFHEDYKEKKTLKKLNIQIWIDDIHIYTIYNCCLIQSKKKKQQQQQRKRQDDHDEHPYE
ncbi:hypothetical protein DERP_002074 [Dermatophagoides pteronyssinus]|uniref:Uncharacterized protein n=1 Tax=Dermatophagoides pteronyssinus TaxID=6956 RepID=A0ABQ8JGP4_DERPT|nr:hypothetical protein DERP_002074 [Dermatophagoides pteronyssinus]